MKREIVLKAKKMFLLYFILPLGSLLAQDKYESYPFADFNYGVLGGINFSKSSEIKGHFLVEVKTTLVDNLNLQLSGGYHNSLEPAEKAIKTFGKITVDNMTYYQAVSYSIINNNYDVFPLSIGLQYILKNKGISPYLLANVSYNFIDAKFEKSPGRVYSYNTFEEIPEEFKTNYNLEVLPDNSYGLALGLGAAYKITNGISIDFRYLYKMDSEIINTHHLLFGIFL